MKGRRECRRWDVEQQRRGSDELMPLHCTTLHGIALCRYVVERALGASDATQRRGVLVLLDCDALSLARNVRPSASDTYCFYMPAPAGGGREVTFPAWAVGSRR